MADLLSKSDRYALLRLRVPRVVYDVAVRRFGTEGLALREFRLRFDELLRALVSDMEAPSGSDGSASCSAPEPAGQPSPSDLVGMRRDADEYVRRSGR